MVFMPKVCFLFMKNFRNFHNLYRLISNDLIYAGSLPAHVQVSYSARHVKMDSASRVPLEPNLARNASHGASGIKYHQQSSINVSQISRGR